MREWITPCRPTKVVPLLPFLLGHLATCLDPHLRAVNEMGCVLALRQHGDMGVDGDIIVVIVDGYCA